MYFAYPFCNIFDHLKCDGVILIGGLYPKLFINEIEINILKSFFSSGAIRIFIMEFGTKDLETA